MGAAWRTSYRSLNRLPPQSQPHSNPQPMCDVEDEHRPNPQSQPEQPIIRSSSVDESRAPSPILEGASDVDRDSTVTPMILSPSGSMPISSGSSQQSSEPAAASDIDDSDVYMYSDIQWPNGQPSEPELEEAVEEVGSSDDHDDMDDIVHVCPEDHFPVTEPPSRRVAQVIPLVTLAERQPPNVLAPVDLELPIAGLPGHRHRSIHTHLSDSIQPFTSEVY
jgi:hypothetical protein